MNSSQTEFVDLIIIIFSSYSGLFRKKCEKENKYRTQNQYANEAVLANFPPSLSWIFLVNFCVCVLDSVYFRLSVFIYIYTKFCVVNIRKMNNFSIRFRISGIDWSKSSVRLESCVWLTFNLFILWPVMVMFFFVIRFAKILTLPKPPHQLAISTPLHWKIRIQF